MGKSAALSAPAEMLSEQFKYKYEKRQYSRADRTYHQHDAVTAIGLFNALRLIRRAVFRAAVTESARIIGTQVGHMPPEVALCARGGLWRHLSAVIGPVAEGKHKIAVLVVDTDGAVGLLCCFVDRNVCVDSLILCVSVGAHGIAGSLTGIFRLFGFFFRPGRGLRRFYGSVHEIDRPGLGGRVVFRGPAESHYLFEQLGSVRSIAVAVIGVRCGSRVFILRSALIRGSADIRIAAEHFGKDIGIIPIGYFRLRFLKYFAEDIFRVLAHSVVSLFFGCGVAVVMTVALRGEQAFKQLIRFPVGTALSPVLVFF